MAASARIFHSSQVQAATRTIPDGLREEAVEEPTVAAPRGKAGRAVAEMPVRQARQPKARQDSHARAAEAGPDLPVVSANMAAAVMAVPAS